MKRERHEDSLQGYGEERRGNERKGEEKKIVVTNISSDPNTKHSNPLAENGSSPVLRVVSNTTRDTRLVSHRLGVIFTFSEHLRREAFATGSPSPPSYTNRSLSSPTLPSSLFPKAPQTHLSTRLIPHDPGQSRYHDFLTSMVSFRLAPTSVSLHVPQISQQPRNPNFKTKKEEKKSAAKLTQKPRLSPLPTPHTHAIERNGRLPEVIPRRGILGRRDIDCEGALRRGCMRFVSTYKHVKLFAN